MIFYCAATGNPVPKITWIKDGKTLAEGNTLSFETNRNQSGKYLCLAQNGLNVTVNVTASLDVQCKYGVKEQNFNYVTCYLSSARLVAHKASNNYNNNKFRQKCISLLELIMVSNKIQYNKTEQYDTFINSSK